MYRVLASFTDAEKFRSIKSVWKPDRLFEFPASKETSGKQRKFRQEWLAKYPRPQSCLFQVLGWRVMFAFYLFRNEVWQKWCQTGLAVSIAAYVLDDGAWKVRQPCKRKVRNSYIFCYGYAEFLGCNEKANRRHLHWSAVNPMKIGRKLNRLWKL